MQDLNRNRSFSGGCLCEKIRYTWSRTPLETTHCHCKMCQRQHGAAFATYVRIERKQLEIHAGAQHIVSYASSEEVLRQFCGICGSTLFFDYLPMPEILFVTAGSMDDHSTLEPAHHIFTQTKASWVELCDDLPKFDEYL